MALVALVVLLVYLGWMAAPYLRSVVARDAAVTSWITVAHSPIAGRITEPLLAGNRVAADGHIAIVINDRADPMPLARAEVDRARAAAERDGLVAEVAALEALFADRQQATDVFRDTFRRNLVDEIDALRASISSIESALQHERSEAERQERMMQGGASSQTEADLARVRAIDREDQLNGTRAALSRAERRLAALDGGAFLLFDESDAGDAQRALDETAIALAAARTELAAAEASLRMLDDAVAMARQQFELARVAVVSAPAGAIVWSQIAGPNTEISAGAPIATWVDCSLLLVDVPISDLEASLLVPGAPAELAIEGQTGMRSGEVLFTRGAAATLSHDDLAAVAKGRTPGIGQAIVKIEPVEGDAQNCPIGRAAFVNFPGVGVIDMIAARLRL